MQLSEDKCLIDLQQLGVSSTLFCYQNYCSEPGPTACSPSFLLGEFQVGFLDNCFFREIQGVQRVQIQYLFSTCLMSVLGEVTHLILTKVIGVRYSQNLHLIDQETRAAFARLYSLLVMKMRSELRQFVTSPSI